MPRLCWLSEGTAIADFGDLADLTPEVAVTSCSISTCVMSKMLVLASLYDFVFDLTSLLILSLFFLD